MAVVILDSGTKGAVATADGDQHILPEGNTLSSEINAFDFDVFSGALEVHGTLISDSSTGGRNGIDTRAGSSPDNIEVTVGDTGSVTGDRSGLDIIAGRATVVNVGYIAGFSGAGAQFITSISTDVTNGGIIFASGNAVGFAAIGESTLVNHGKLIGGNGLWSTGSTRITNSGDIIGEDNTSRRDTGFGISVFSFRGSTVELDNSGVIFGSVAAYNSRALVIDIIENSGEFQGDVNLGESDDSYTATSNGVIYGTLNAGSGDDRATGADADDDFNGEEGNDTLSGKGGSDTLAGGTGDDILMGGDGDDSLHGGDDNDKLFGGFGDDAIDGNSGKDTVLGGDGTDQIRSGSGADLVIAGAGDDKIFGGSGKDKIAGGSGNDTLNGGLGKDTLKGNSGDDILNGGIGDDSLKGGDGNDTLTGGLDSDTLTGGTGADTFVWSKASDAPEATPDLVTDFDTSQDRLDLRALGIETVLIDAAFSGNGQSALRLSGTTGTLDVAITIDINGDGVVDGRIVLQDAFDLSQFDAAPDFILV